MSFRTASKGYWAIIVKKEEIGYMRADIPEGAGALLEKAIGYDDAGDVYNAVKLYKRVIQLAPDLVLPYVRLARIYKNRCEWKSALHYAKKAIALDAGDSQTWWDMGLAASALGKERLCRAVWQKFGVQEAQGKVIAVQVQHSGIFELFWAQTLDPAKAVLASIPHPDSGLRYRDIVLIDREIVGYQMAGKRKTPVYPALCRLKQSFYQTFTCVLEASSDPSFRILEKLCADAGVGMEIWSDAVWAKSRMPGQRKPEYFGKEIFNQPGSTAGWAALAARKEQEAQEVLRNWAVICLGSYTDFETW